MDDNLLNSVYVLKEYIDNLPQNKRLKELSKMMEEDEDVIRLVMKKEEASHLYEDALKHFSFESKEAKDARIALIDANEKLHANVLVKEYDELYRFMREIDHYIEEQIFVPFRKGK